uniref:Uncharacterized protein n=1 Tax=Panagrellus redivivus TaxID=6233 RepID=A0A7E5A0S0_PANRE
MEEEPKPGPSTAPPVKLNPVFTKTLSESDSSESGLGANDTRLPPPPPPIDVKALQAAIFDECNDNDDQRPSSSASQGTGMCYKKCTSYRLDPPLLNPVDLAVSFNMVAIADYDNGVHFVDFRGRVRRHLVTEPIRICGVRFRTSGEHQQVIMLAYCDQKWSIVVKTWPSLQDVKSVECPNEPQIMSWARRKISIIDNYLFLLGTCDSCSAIWTLDLEAYTWKTLIVERSTSKKTSTGISLGSSFRMSGSNNDDTRGVYSDFDARAGTDAERRILLCQSEKSKLDILRINETDKLIGSNTIKMKRRKNQQWIINGPQLAVFDSEQDIIVYDASGKIFWFDGATYRIQKIVGDVGKGEVCALQAENGWCYALCRHRLCVHAFMYRT